MRDRFITWGTLDSERRLFTFELEIEDAQIIRRVLSPGSSSEEMMQTVMNAWIQMTTIQYPADTDVVRIPFSSAGSIVPEGAEVEDKVRVASAEREWPFDVVSFQMKRQFQSELEELRDIVNELNSFEEAIFERLKNAWAKIQTEVSNHVLRYEHSLPLRAISDEAFATLKKLRRGEVRQRQSASKGIKKELLAELAGAQTKLEDKKDLRVLFDDLRHLQDKLNKASLGRDDRQSLRNRLDELFKATKSEINASGADAQVLSQKRGQLEGRLRGLQGAISRMRYSVDRDNKDMFYEHRRAENAGNQLAEQLAVAKLAMLGEQARSKAARLDDMLATEADLLKRLDKLIASEQRAQAKRKEALAPSKAALVGSSDGEKVTGPPGLKAKKRGKRNTSERAANSTRLVSNKMVRDAVAISEIFAEDGSLREPQ